MQVRHEMQKMFYFTHPNDESYIVAVSKTGECQKFEFKGESEYTDWTGCQVGQNRFFQLDIGEVRFRILKMDPIKKCLSIEREGDQPIYDGDLCCGLANFRDKFVFVITNEGSNRYSLAEDKWEKLPRIRIYDQLSACSLGDKVYVLDPARRVIKVLHNPDAPASSQEIHWQDVVVPGDVPIPRYYHAFAPLNST